MFEVLPPSSEQVQDIIARATENLRRDEEQDAARMRTGDVTQEEAPAIHLPSSEDSDGPTVRP